MKSKGVTHNKYYSLVYRFKAWLQRAVVEGLILRRHAERLYLVLGGHIFFQSLHAAVKFDLFSILAESPGLTRNEIASRLGIQPQPARILLLNLTAAGFLRKRADRYFNTRVTRELFGRGSRTNISSYVSFEGELIYPAMPHLYESLRQYRNVGIDEFEGTEATLYERISRNEFLQGIFQDAMSALSVQTNRLLANFVDLSGVTYLVDVGGGDSTNIVALAKKYPQLRASVFDLPSVCKVADEKLIASGLDGRLSTICGNCFSDLFPVGADCFLFAHFMTMWSEEKDRLILQKSFEALKPGGKAIIFNMMQHDDETGPLSAAVGSPYFLALATGEGMLYTWKEYEQWMRDAGFSDVKRIVLPRDHGAIVGVKH